MEYGMIELLWCNEKFLHFVSANYPASFITYILIKVYVDPMLHISTKMFTNL